jgi:hypothetical protein
MTLSTDLTSRPDLTRWNRAGLNQLQYLDGNAATYLEDLRLALRQAFAGNVEVLSWLDGDQPQDPALSDKTLRDWQRRLLAQYGAARRDYAWELLRSFARATHVLTHTANAYANERYINTATQWDNLRRLVNMLDYHPAPPASAQTWVALFAKMPDVDKGITGIGNLAPGLALQNQPQDGSSPVIFETLQPLALDYRLNELRAPNADRSVAWVTIPATGGTFDYPLETVPEGVSVGDRGVLAQLNQAAAVKVVLVGSDYLRLQVIEQGFTARAWALADLRLQLLPTWQQAPQLNGANVMEVDKANNALAVNDLLVYASGSSWLARSLVAIEGNRVELDQPLAVGTALYQTLRVHKQQINGHTRFVLPPERGASSVWKTDRTALSPSTEQAAGATNTPLYHYISGDTNAYIHYLAVGTPVAFRVVSASNSSAYLQFSGKPGDLASGDWIILQNADGHFYSRAITGIGVRDGSYRLSLNLPAGQRWTLAQGLFTEAVPPRGYNQNHEAIYHSSTGTHSQLSLSLTEIPPALSLGRALWVVSEADPQLRACQLVTVQEILSFANAELVISVKPGLSGLHLPKYATRVYANVTLAGHGESRGQTVLGNGNRLEPNQEFIYRKTDLAFEQDNQFVSGVRAAVTVVVDDRRWTQVDNLRDSEAADTHFEATLTEDEHLRLRFGDGIHGQRLPTGTNNVLIEGRFGSGTQGNLPAGSLNKLKKPHALVEAVLQPSAATGGAERESAESLRHLAPASVLTLDRAVSVADFGHIARRHASIWQARSHALPATARASDRVEVVLVPAGGGALSADLAAHLKTYLEGFSRPGVFVSIKNYQAILLDVELTLRVDISAYDGNQVAEQVRLTLLDSFSLSNAMLAEPLYLSRLYQVIESVEGVENVALQLNTQGFVDETGAPVAPADAFYGADGSLRRISPAPHQLIYLNNNLRPPRILWEQAYV